MQLRKNINKTLIIATLIYSITGCIIVDIKGAGVFKDIRYDNRNISHIKIPKGAYGDGIKFFDIKDGSEIGFQYLDGGCSGGGRLSGIIIPFFPFFYLNKCTKNGFIIYSDYPARTLGVNFQLRYDGITKDPYIDNGNVKFKIENFSEFKKAKDKTLITHKKKPDGTMFTKELPFEWEIVVETSGGL